MLVGGLECYFTAALPTSRQPSYDSLLQQLRALKKTGLCKNEHNTFTKIHLWGMGLKDFDGWNLLRGNPLRLHYIACQGLEEGK